MKSFNGDHESTFVGTDAEWQAGHRDHLSYGDKYVMDMPEYKGMARDNDLMYSGEYLIFVFLKWLYY